MATTYTLIEKITVGAAGATDVTFTSIPQTYTDLQILISARSNRTSDFRDDHFIRFNGNTGTNYTTRNLNAISNSIGSGTDTSQTSLGRMTVPANSSNVTVNTFGSSSIYIPNYTSSNNKSVSTDNVMESNSTTYWALTMTAGLWAQTGAITSITIFPEVGSYMQYSTFYLYGIAKEGVSPTPSSAPYATGGDSILFDGTYWIHTFRSSGTFTPKKNLTCDYLVVAGGGGGGKVGGGGGAGGLRSTVTATGGGGSLESALSLAANTGYTVTVGAGGNGTTSGNNGTNGSNSVFSTITSTGGGKGGDASIAGSSGGSGGGGSYGGAAGGTATSGQGYNGGTGGLNSAPNYPGGGGGGAGATGGSASGSATTAGNGGNGVATSISGSSVTYGGGGGGGTYAGGTVGTGGTGGGGAAGTAGATSNGTAGTANTGGGGGSASSSTTATANSGSGGNGGSGIVIVRYAA